MFTPTLRRSFAFRPSHASSKQVFTTRPFHLSTQQFARKDAQDKDSLKPEPNEYSKSGSDDAAAAVEDAAFDPKKTSPEAEHASAQKEAKSEGVSLAAIKTLCDNPLEVSPANQEVSKPKEQPQGEHEGSSAQSGGGPSDRQRTSGGSSPPKSGGGKHGGGSQGV
ncbi:hypothetical protein B0A55_03376 [Friedmanniomyces simplex]|uniref:Uncharacterized protein n=1 Tax=Friedmanniomyces simplex TaxID=329884 RepID=A0A4U0XWU2_9PEZI|nr:hypothetical protein B0A55_03376 [Friedmanniomyces simplex]